MGEVEVPLDSIVGLICKLKRPEPSDGLSIDLLASFDQLRELASEWDDLAASVPSHSAAHTFVWASTGWTIRQPSDSLCCVIVRQHGRLVCVWPFLVRPRGRLRVLEPLGSGGNEEYGGPLLAADAPAEPVIRLAWAAMRRRADAAFLYNLEPDSRLEQELLAPPAIFSRVKVPDLFISFKAAVAWEDFAATRSRKLMSDLRRQNKRLRGLGRLEFGPVDDPDRVAAGVEWMLLHKRRWMDATGRPGDWIRSKGCQDFLTRAAMEAAGHTRAGVGAPRLFLLTLDRQPIAAGYALVNPSVFEFYITAYDAALENYSPGKVLLEHLTRWAFDRGLAFDFRVVTVPYKEQWANAGAWRSTLVIATTTRGFPLVAAAWTRNKVMSAREALGQAVRRATGQSFRELLHRRRGG